MLRSWKSNKDDSTLKDLYLALIQYLDTDELLQQVLPWNRDVHEQLLGSLMDLGQSQVNPPDLTFVPEPTLANQFQLLIEAIS